MGLVFVACSVFGIISGFVLSCWTCMLVVVLAASWIVAVNLATVVFDGFRRFQRDVAVYFAFYYFFESLPFGGFIGISVFFRCSLAFGDGLFEQFFDFCSVVVTIVVVLVVWVCRLAGYLRVASTTKGGGANVFSVYSVLCIWSCWTCMLVYVLFRRGGNSLRCNCFLASQPL